MKRLVPGVVLYLCAVAGGQVPGARHTPQTQEELHARVLALYSFHPASVSAAERASKSAEMDAFWEELKARPEVTLPLLRAELRKPEEPSFFYTDGTELLLNLSKAREDEELAATLLPRMDLTDTQPTVYFQMAHHLAVDGIDVTAGALHILDDKTFRVSVPQHAMTLDQRTALMYLLLALREELWVKPVEARFAAEHDTDAKSALLFAMFYAQTDDADAAVKRISNDPTQPEPVRVQARKFIQSEQADGKSPLQVSGTVASLREQRRQRLHAVSDEAMDDVQSITENIAALRAEGRG